MSKLQVNLFQSNQSIIQSITLSKISVFHKIAPQNRDGCMKIDHGDCDWHSDCCDGLKCDYDWGWKTDYCVAGPETRYLRI